MATRVQHGLQESSRLLCSLQAAGKAHGEELMMGGAGDALEAANAVRRDDSARARGGSAARCEGIFEFV
jgi:hypothetical protein